MQGHLGQCSLNGNKAHSWRAKAVPLARSRVGCAVVLLSHLQLWAWGMPVPWALRRKKPLVQVQVQAPPLPLPLRLGGGCLLLLLLWHLGLLHGLLALDTVPVAGAGGLGVRGALLAPLWCLFRRSGWCHLCIIGLRLRDRGVRVDFPLRPCVGDGPYYPPRRAGIGGCGL